MIPRVPDVLADAMKKVVHREGCKAMSIEKYIVGEQRLVPPSNSEMV